MNNLPAIKDLYNENVILSKKNDLNVLVNQNPKDDWLKQHPIIKNVKYIPIERIEWLLTSIFIDWNVEVKSIQLIANSVVTVIRLHYRCPVTSEMKFQDGIGASPLQTDKDSGAIEFNKIKSDAVMKAAPSSESFAVKDAAEKIGKLFGKDINRADKIMYDSLLGKFEETDASNLGLLINSIDNLSQEKQKIYKEKLKQLRSKKQLTDDVIKEMIIQVQNDLS